VTSPNRLTEMRFYLNIDHVATVRQARGTDEPDPVRAAVLAELAGVDGITVHLREDRRHIQDRDVRLLMETVRTGVNLELAATSEILDLACEWRPMQATLVPEKREELTTEGGLDLSSSEQLEVVGEALVRLEGGGIRTSLFIDPTSETIRAARELGADAIELHTGDRASMVRRGNDSNKKGRISCSRNSSASASSCFMSISMSFHAATFTRRLSFEMRWRVPELSRALRFPVVGSNDGDTRKQATKESSCSASWASETGPIS